MDSRIPNNDVIENNVAYVDSIPIAAKYHAGISPQSLTLWSKGKRKEKRRRKKEEEEDKAKNKEREEKERIESIVFFHDRCYSRLVEDEGIKPFLPSLNVLRALYRLSLSPLPSHEEEKSRYRKREREREAVSPPVIDNDNFVSPIPRGNGSNEGSPFYLLHRGVPSKGAKEGGREREEEEEEGVAAHNAGEAGTDSRVFCPIELNVKHGLTSI